MDLPAGQPTAGYMDVAPNAYGDGGSGGTAGYMDVQVNGAAPVTKEDFGGFDDANSEDV